jgi:hypothetical protein
MRQGQMAAPLFSLPIVNQGDGAEQAQITPFATDVSIEVLSAGETLPAALDMQGAPYIGYGIHAEYAWDMGLLATPIAGPPGTPAEVTRVHGGLCFKVVEWAAQRLLELPQLPSSDTGSTNEVLLFKQISPAMRNLLPDGTPIWTVAGRYGYVLLVPPSDNDPMLIPAAPFDLGRFQLTVLTPANYTKEMLGPVPSVTGQLSQGVTY